MKKPTMIGISMLGFLLGTMVSSTWALPSPETVPADQNPAQELSTSAYRSASFSLQISEMSDAFSLMAKGGKGGNGSGQGAGRGGHGPGDGTGNGGNGPKDGSGPRGQAGTCVNS